MAAGESLRSIAVRLGRSASTVSREVARNGGRSRYRAHRADLAAWERARRPKPYKLAANLELWFAVEEKLGLWWSPQQISGWLKEAYPASPEMWVSHETIYLSLFVQGRGALKHELTQCLRTHRVIRRPVKKRAPTGKGQIREPVMISERPAEADDRAVPGHWEGDLLMGKRMTAIGTLVERWSRYVMLFPLPEDDTAESVRSALAETIQRLPEHLWQSLTWDQGKEMAEHASSPSTAASRSTSVTPNRRGSAVPTRTPRATPSVFPQDHRHGRPHPRRPRPSRLLAQHQTSTNPRLDDTITETRRNVAMTP